jgi:hypothetical protein
MCSADLKKEHLPNVDGGLLGAHTVVEVRGDSLSITIGDGLSFTDIVGGAVCSVGTLQGNSILGADGGEDSVGSGNGSSLEALTLDGRVGTRVEKNESVLLGSNSTEVTGSDRSLQSSDALSVIKFGTLDSGCRDGTIGRGHGGESNNTGNSSSGDATHDSTAIHVLNN